VQWWLLAGSAIMWVVVLVPFRRSRSERRTISDHERRMELLASAEVHGTSGRWIVTPRKGMRFLSPRERERARARSRRRHIFVFLLEALGLSLLIGLVPPLRAVWIASALLAGLLLVYVWLLLVIRGREPSASELAVHAAVAAPASATPAAARRHVAAGSPSVTRPIFDDLGALGEGDTGHVGVKEASAGA
jgi:Flp pilus assembly protein TadB